MLKSVFVLASLLCNLLWVSPAMADDSDASSDAWKRSVVIYLMGPNIDGTVGVGPVEGDIDLDPGDVFDTFDSGFLGIFAAEKDRWGFIIDGVYMDLSQDATSDRGLVTGSVGTRQTILGALASYRLSESTQFLFGGLYVDVSNTLSLTGPVQERRFKAGDDWIDPTIGVRLSRPLNEKWSLGGMATIGGFGVGSDFSWAVTGSVAYALSARTYLVGGYRYMDFDYEDGAGLDRFKFDVAEYGAALGFRFDF